MASEARYRPKPVPGDIPEVEIPYVELFGDLADVVEATEESEHTVLLLSTCRNVWMTINAVFVDIRELIGHGDLYDRFSTMLFHLSRGEGDRALRIREECGLRFDQVREKLEVWNVRLELAGALEEVIAARDGVSRSRLHHLMDRQRERRPTDQVAHGDFLALDLDTVPPKAEELLGCLAACAERLRMISGLVKVLAPFATSLAPLLDEHEDGEGSQGTIFQEAPESLGQNVRATAVDNWPAISEALEKASEKVPALEPIAARATTFSGAEFDVERAKEELAEVLAAARDAVGAEQEKLAGEFPPNVAVAPMPPLFQVDLSRVTADGEAHGERFTIETRSANADQERDSAAIAVLRCGLPESAYSHVNPSDYVFEDDQPQRAQVIEVAKAAIARAAEEGCVALAMPEVFLPRARVEEIEELAEERGLLLIAGVEYRQASDHKRAINELIVSLPGVSGPLRPRKQRPSVYEAREKDFEGDGKVWVFKHTALGNVGVLICSDYLEFDVLAGLVAVPERLDTLIVCSRNPAPRVFETLAIADAARLYASVVVANARPEGQKEGQIASGEGTIVAVPTHEGLLEATGTISLNTEWEGGEPPELKTFDLPLGKIRSRDRRRPEGSFLPAPFYSQKLGG